MRLAQISKSRFRELYGLASLSLCVSRKADAFCFAKGVYIMPFDTIRKTAARPDCPISEGTLRAMCKRGEVPGFYRGSRFYINFNALIETLQHRSMATISGNGERTAQ